MKIGIALGAILLILLVGLAVLVVREKEEGGVSLQEQELIGAWIIEQGLNQYGDPKDTVYMGGTPLFDERTGQSIDKYEYILRNHPLRPWRK